MRHTADSLEHFNREGFKHQRESRVLPAPGNRNRFDTAGLAVAARSTSSQYRFELHHVEMTPLSLGSLIRLRASCITFGAAQAPYVNQINDNPIGFHLKFNF